MKVDGGLTGGLSELELEGGEGVSHREAKCCRQREQKVPKS